MSSQETCDESATFFIVGSVRSGTTLLRLMLGQHSQVCQCEEMDFVASALATTHDWPDMDVYRHELKLDRGFRLSGYALDGTLGFKDLARSFLTQRRHIDRCPIVGATVHNNFDELPRIWPDAKYIFLTRDPRDVAMSCVQMGFVGTAWGGAGFWIQAQEAWDRLAITVPSARLMRLRFECLVTEPEAELKKICRFLKIEYDSSVMNINLHTTYSRPGRDQATSWRTSATAYEIRQVEARIDPTLLTRDGYVPSGLPRLRLSWLQKRLILVNDVMVRLRFGIKRYGLWLWSAGVVARRVGYMRFRESIKLKMDGIDNDHLK